MVRNFRRKLLLLTICLIILAISSIYTITPSAQAKPTDSVEKGLSMIDKVAGFNLTQYNAITTVNPSDTYLGILPTENVRYSLFCLGDTAEIQATFTQGSLQIMSVLEDSRWDKIQALPSKVASTFDESLISVMSVQKAIFFLLNYQEYSADPFYGQLVSTLKGIDATKNSTTTIGNMHFKIEALTGNSTIDNITTFTWSYTSDGIDADCKCVSLSYKDGFLKGFIDNWNLYPIGSTTVKLSKHQAEAIAIQNAKTFSWKVGTDSQQSLINNFNVTEPIVANLFFEKAGNASNARNSNPLTLYPIWSIGVGLDKYYPGKVYGIHVGVWADTGQVRDRQEVYSTLPLPANAKVATIAESSKMDIQVSSTANGFSDIWIPAVSMTFIVIAILFLLTQEKPWLRHSLTIPKMRKSSGLAFCLLLFIAAILALASTAATASATDGSVDIWADTHPAISPSYPNPHTQGEIDAQRDLSAYIDSRFYNHGYDHYNHQPSSGTTPSAVLSSTQSHEQTHIGTATIWFDHGIGLPNNVSQPPLSQNLQIPNWQNYPTEFHFMLCGATAGENDPINDVFDYQIYAATSTSNNYFSFISACMSGKTDLQNLDPPPNEPPPHLIGNGQYGANPYPNSGAPIGMPYAWTHNATGIPNEGYKNPDETSGYCYIGFPWGSPALALPIDNFWSNTTATYYDFVHAFYYHALDCHETVNSALNSASQDCFNTQLFRDTALCVGFVAHWPYLDSINGTRIASRMAVYGNGNIRLRSRQPRLH